MIVAGLLVWAADERHPYSFYTLLRWICCPVFAYSAFAVHGMKRVPWVWVFGTLAALYNPIFHVELDRDTWIIVNWVTAGAISIAIGFFLASETIALRGGLTQAAGETLPPVPASGDSESKRSASPKKSKAKVISVLVCLLVLVFGVVAYSVNVVTRYHAFTSQLSAVQGIHIGDSRDEVKYRLGFPRNVRGPVEQDYGGYRGHRNPFTPSPEQITT